MFAPGDVPDALPEIMPFVQVNYDTYFAPIICISCDARTNRVVNI